MNGLINVGELVKRIIKYLVEGLMVAIAAYAIPKRSLNIEEIVLISRSGSDSHTWNIGIQDTESSGSS